LDKEILKSLLQSGFEWLYDLLHTLGNGQITEFAAAIQKHNQVIQRYPQIMKEIDYLKQKVAIIAFLEFVFQLDQNDRNIPFSEIARVCQIDLPVVEMLVMKAMSLSIVRGSIDEAKQTVEISWIRPRYLNKEHL